jgi:hypothetical protein
MSEPSLVYPMSAMVLLTMFVLVRMFRARVGAVKAGQIDANFYRLFQGATEPAATQKVSRNFSNLFEAPTLFYVVCLAAMVTGVTGLVMVALAWAYVATRIAHTAIHLGPNKLRWRIRAYFLSWATLAAMWVTLVIGIAGRASS